MQIAVALERIERGGVLALATVEISISGVPVTLQGLKVRRGLDGLMSVELPMFEHPTAARFSASGFIDDLSRGVVDEIIAAWSGAPRDNARWRAAPHARSPFRNLTPAPPPFSAINSTPADLRAARILAIVRASATSPPVSNAALCSYEMPDAQPGAL